MSLNRQDLPRPLLGALVVDMSSKVWQQSERSRSSEEQEFREVKSLDTHGDIATLPQHKILGTVPAKDNVE